MHTRSSEFLFLQSLHRYKSSKLLYLVICKRGLLFVQYDRGSVSLAFSHREGTVNEVKTYNTYMMATSSAQPLELKYQQPATTVSYPDTFVCSVQKVDRNFVGFEEGHS